MLALMISCIVGLVVVWIFRKEVNMFDDSLPKDIRYGNWQEDLKWVSILFWGVVFLLRGFFAVLGDIF